MLTKWDIDSAEALIKFSQVDGNLIPYDDPNFVISIALQSGVNYLDLTKPCEEKGQTLYFRSLGTENKPFAGTIKAADNKTLPIHLDKALFNYLSTSASIGSNLQLASIKENPTGALLANYVVGRIDKIEGSTATDYIIYTNAKIRTDLIS